MSEIMIGAPQKVKSSDSQANGVMLLERGAEKGKLRIEATLGRTVTQWQCEEGPGYKT